MTENQQQKPTGSTLARTVIDRNTANTIQVNTRGGLAIKSAAEAMEFAKMMSISGSAVRKHLRNNPGTCLAVSIQSWEWSMNPFAVANKSYVVNDQLAYESALYNAVATQRAPIVGRLKVAYEGEGPMRQCTVSATLNEGAGGLDIEYKSPQFSQINPKNSPLWKNDPDQQLCYFSVRSFVRRHFPDVMMGVYTVDELQDIEEPVRQQGARRKLVDNSAAPDEAGSFGGMEFGKPPFSDAPPAEDEPELHVDQETGEETTAAEPAPNPEAAKQGQRKRFGP